MAADKEREAAAVVVAGATPEDDEEDEGRSRGLLRWDGFSAWLHCVCVVGFDLELGQALEVRGPRAGAGAAAEGGSCAVAGGGCGSGVAEGPGNPTPREIPSGSSPSGTLHWSPPETLPPSRGENVKLPRPPIGMEERGALHF